MQLTRKKDMAGKSINITFYTMSILILLIDKPNLSELLMAQVSYGFLPDQPRIIALIKIVDVYLNRCARRNAEGIRERGHVGHIYFDEEAPSRAEIVVADFPHR